jgi:hypothetical protein
VARDLLVRQAGGDAGHDVALPDGERIDPPERRAQPPDGAPSGEQPAQQRGRPVHD